jgi:hypothetical protein
MRKKIIALIILSLLLQLVACNNEPFKPRYKNVKGYVIGKESCNIDENQDYWLIDLTYLPNTPQYGDTLLLNGQIFTNVVKTKGLRDTVKHIGKAVSIDFNKISTDKVVTVGCNVSGPVTYNLKEIFVINLFEIR